MSDTDVQLGKCFKLLIYMKNIFPDKNEGLNQRGATVFSLQEPVTLLRTTRTLF
jgi:hypothetical protein